MADVRVSWRMNRLLARARALLKRGNGVDALPLCQEAVTLAPKSLTAWQWLIRAYSTLQRRAETLDACERALSVKPEDAWVWAHKGVALIYLRRYEEALQAVEHVSPRARRYAESAAWTRVQALSALGRYETLLAVAEQWTRDEPKESRNWRWLGVALDGLARHEEALSAFTRATLLNPRDVDGWAHRALTLYYLGRHDDALAACERVAALDPENINAARVKVLCLVDERRFDEALAASDYTIALPRASASDHGNRGIALLRAGRYVDAMDALARSLAMNPDNPSALNSRGSVYARLQYDERALREFERVCARHESYIAAWCNAGGTLTELGRYDEAHARLTRAATLAKAQNSHIADAELHAAFGTLRARQGQFDEALAEYRDALAVEPRNDAVCRGYAETLLALGEVEQAISNIERAIAWEPFEARGWSLKGRILRAAGDITGADTAEVYGRRMLAEQRAQLAAWERAHPEWAGV